MILMKNIVRVWIRHPYENGIFNGTAFFINKNTLLTAKHVVMDEYSDNIYLSDTPDGGIVSIDEVILCERDIAVLKIKNTFEIVDIEFTNELRIEDIVKIYGFHDKNGARNIKRLNVSGYLNTIHTYELQSHLSEGFSGSPVFLDGKICGITQAINDAKNITYIIPIEETCSKSLKNIFTKPYKKNINLSSTLEHPTGIVPIDSPNYLEREADKKCYKKLYEPYTLIHIKAPIQYGKTSLLTRLIAKAEEKSYSVIFLEFQDFDKWILSDLKNLLESIHEKIVESLNIEVTLNSRIINRLSAKEKSTRYMEKILLEVDNSIVLFIDEANILFEYHDVSDDFFGLIRSWHEFSKRKRVWKKLKIILAHSIAPRLSIRNINQSPFHNVGVDIELKPFSKDDIEDLSLRHNIKFKDKELDEFIHFVGGHPFLSRKILYSIAKEGKQLDEIIKDAHGSRSIFSDDLKIYIRIIREDDKLTKTLKKILRGERCEDYESCYILESMGLIHYNLDRPIFSCELYRGFFNQIL
jgi:V8-like Glu-specific endopeptidase